MNSGRKRHVRLVVSLTLAVALASGLVYTSFSAADPALTPTQLLAKAQPGVTYQLTGTVVAGMATLRAARALGCDPGYAMWPQATG